MHFCSLSHQVYGILLGQPKLTNIGSSKNRALQAALSEEVTCQLRSKRGVWGGHGNIWGKTIQAEGTASAKVL